MLTTEEIYLESALKTLNNYKSLAEKAMGQLADSQVFWQASTESNSIAIIVKHMVGNMRSRWTDFLTSDGEKPWRKRDSEFESDLADRAALMSLWNEGWTLVFDTLQVLSAGDLAKTIYIRGEAHSVIDAINRQIAHYASHVGQIIFIAKMVSNEAWISLSIPRGQSEQFNSNLL